MELSHKESKISLQATFFNCFQGIEKLVAIDYVFFPSLQQEAFDTSYISCVRPRKAVKKTDFINRPRLPISFHPEDNTSHALLSLRCKISSSKQRKRKKSKEKRQYRNCWFENVLNKFQPRKQLISISNVH